MAILLHKFTETSMLCITLIMHRVKFKKLVFMLTVYSLIEPLGVCIGWLLSVFGL